MKNISFLFGIVCLFLTSSLKASNAIFFEEHFDTFSSDWTVKGPDTGGYYPTNWHHVLGVLQSGNTRTSYYKTYTLISKPFDLGYRSTELSFTYLCQYNTDFKVFVSLDGGKTYLNNVVFNKATLKTRKLQHVLVDLSLYKNKTIQLVFEHKNSHSSIEIDDIIVQQKPLCPKAVNLESSKLNVTSFDVSWLGTNTDTYHLIVCDAPQINPLVADPLEIVVNKTLHTVENKVHIDGLLPAHTYYVYLQSDCSSFVKGKGRWSSELVVSTPCSALSLPYYIDFNSSSGLPDCWMSHSDNHFTPRVISHYDEYFFKMAVDEIHDALVILPHFDEDISNMMLHFKACSRIKEMQFQVGVTNDISDLSAFVSLSTLEIGDTWQEYSVFLNNQAISGDDYFLALYCPSGQSDNIGNTSILIDDLTIDNSPSCVYPIQLDASQIENSQLVLNWKDYNKHPQNFTIEYTKKGEKPQIVSALKSPYILAGLDGNTSYSIRVRANCSSNDQSEYSMPISIRTQMNPIVINQSSGIYTEDFETSDSYKWQVKDTDEKNYWVIGTAIAESGTHAMYTSKDKVLKPLKIYPNAASHTYTYCDLDINEAGFYRIAFDMNSKNSSSSYARCLLVKKSVDFVAGNILQYEAGDGWMIMDKNDVAYNQILWKHYSKAIEIEEPGKYRLVFYWYNASFIENGYYFACDNVCIQPVTCVDPTEFEQTGVSQNQVNFTWKSRANNHTICILNNKVEPHLLESQGNIEIRKSNIQGNTASVDQLRPGVTYYAYIQADCSPKEQSRWVGPIEFTSDCAAQKLPYTENFESYKVYDYLFPNCWKKETLPNAQLSGFYVHTNAHNPLVNKTQNLLLSAFKDDSTTIVLPEMQGSNISNLLFSFDYMFPYHAQAAFYVGYVTNSMDYSSFVPLDTLSSHYKVVHYQLDYTKYTIPSGSQIALFCPKSKNERPYTMSLDNMIVEEMLQSLPIQSLEYTDLLDHSVKIKWEDKLGSVLNYNVEYGLKDFVTGQGTKLLSKQYHVELNHLKSNTEYSVRVQVNRKGKLSPWHSIDFTTLKPMVDASYFQCQFEADEDTLVWYDRHELNENRWEIGKKSSLDGKRGLYVVKPNGKIGYDSSIDSESYKYAYLDCTQGDYMLSFDALCNGDFQDYFNCYIVHKMLTKSDFDTHQLEYFYAHDDKMCLVNHKLFKQAEWKHYEFVFSLNKPQIISFVMAWYNNSIGANPPAIQIDNIALKRLSCIKPMDIHLSTISGREATLVWHNDQVKSYELLVAKRKLQANEMQTIQSAEILTRVKTVSASYVLKNLYPQTKYFCYLRAYCNLKDTSLWSDVFEIETPCALQRMPVIYNFENDEEYAFPSCWTQIGQGEVKVTNRNHCDEGERSLKIVIHKDEVCQMILPLTYLESPIENYQIEFDVYQESSHRKPFNLDIGQMDDIQDNTSYSSLIQPTSILAKDAGKWEHYRIPFDHPLDVITGQPKKLLDKQYFVVTIAGVASVYIDNIKLSKQASCSKPTNVLVKDITADKATLYWQGSGALGSQLEIVNEKLGNVKRYLLNKDTLCVTDLNAHTHYSTRVRAICAVKDTSEWTVETPFSTICTYEELPYIEDFNAVYYDIPMCWTTQSNSSRRDWSKTTIGYLGMGMRYGTVDNSGLSNRSQMFSSIISLEKNTRALLSFYYKYNSDYSEVDFSLAVENYQTGHKTILSPLMTKTNEWTYCEYDLSAFCQQKIRLVFDGVINSYSSQGEYIYIDQLKVEDKSYVELPKISIDQITKHSAIVRLQPDASDYHNVYLVANDEKLTSSTLPIRILQDTLLLDHLNHSTLYKVYAQGVLAQDTGLVCNPICFHTNCESRTTPYLEDFERNQTPLCWNDTAQVMRLNQNMSSQGEQSLELPQQTLLFSPIFEKNLNTLEMRYHVWTLDTLLVGATINQDPLSVCYLDTIVGYKSMSKAKILDFSSLSLEYNTVVFNKIKGDNTFLDAVYFSEKVNCEKLCDVEFSSIYSDSICVRLLNDTQDLIDIAYGEASKFDIQLAKPNFIEVGDSTWITHLQSNTLYAIYVRSRCLNQEFGRWVGPYHVYTDCTPMVIQKSNDYYESLNQVKQDDGHRDYSTIPSCWSLINSTYNSELPHTYFVNNYPYNNANYCNHLRAESGSSDTLYITFPEVMNNLNALSLEIDMAYSYSTQKTSVVEVGVMTHKNDSETFVAIDTLNYDQLNPDKPLLYKRDMRYVALPTSSQLFAIRLLGGRSTLDIDALRMTNVGVADVPWDIQLLNLTRTSVDVAAKFVVSAYEFQVELYNLKTYSCDTITQKDLSICRLIDLKSGTPYQIRLRTHCKNSLLSEWSNWSEPVIFNTLNKPTNVPYATSFERKRDNDLWLSTNGISKNNWIIGNSSSAVYDKQKALYISYDTQIFDYDHQERTVNWTYRLFHLEAGSYAIKYMVKAGGEQDHDYLRAFLIPDSVVLCTTHNDHDKPYLIEGEILSSSEQPNHFIDLLSGIQTFSNHGWTQISNIIYIPSSGNYHLSFVWNNDESKGTKPSVSIDSLSIESLNCATPVGFEKIGHTTSSITLCAQDYLKQTDALLKYVVLNKDSSFISSSFVKEFTGNSGDTITITGLNPGTFYKAYVARICQKGFSEWTDSIEFCTDQKVSEIPYYCGFEKSEQVESNWLFVNDHDNQWIVGKADAKDGTQSLYISKDKGISNQYDFMSNTNSYVVQKFYFTPGDYVVSYDWKCLGEKGIYGISDFARMYLLKGEVIVEGGNNKLSDYERFDAYINNFDRIINSTVMVGNSQWQHYSKIFHVEDAASYHCIIGWQNDNSGGNNPACVIDNFSIKPVSCQVIKSIDINKIESNSVSVSWETEAPETQICIFERNNPQTYVYNQKVQDTNVKVSNLKPHTTYSIKLRAICGLNDSSLFSEIETFTTDCSIYKVPYRETFKSSVTNDCWSHKIGFARYDRVLFSDLKDGYSHWKINKQGSINQTVGLVGSGTKAWLISPKIEVHHNDILHFEASLTRYNSLDKPNSFGSDNRFIVFVSTDGGATWNNQSEWSSASPLGHQLKDISEKYRGYSIRLTQQELDTIQFAFYAESTEINTDNDLHIANVSINCVEDTVFIQDTICSGYPYTKNDFLIPIEDVHNGQYETFVCSEKHGNSTCDEIRFLDLTVRSSSEKDTLVTICEGDVYDFGGFIIKTSGDYIQTLSSAYGCDSIVNLHLDVQKIELSIDSFICTGESIHFAGQTISQSGLYCDTVKNAQGCDSVTHLSLIVLPEYTYIKDTICEGDFYDFNHQKLTQSGTYKAKLQNRLHCDSLVTLDLRVIPLKQTIRDQFCKGSSYLFIDKLLKNPGTYKDTIPNYLGSSCMHIKTLILTQTVPDTTWIKDQFCEGDLSYNNFGFGIPNPETKDYYSTKQSSVTGCDSTTVLQLTQILTLRTHDSQSFCEGDYFHWGNKDYDVAGVYQSIFQSSLGCDSIVELELTMNPSYELSMPITLSTHDLPYENFDVTIPKGINPGVYDFQAHGKTHLGCDSILNLTITLTEGDRLNTTHVRELFVYPSFVKTNGIVEVQIDALVGMNRVTKVQLVSALGKIVQQYSSQYIVKKYKMPAVSGVYYLTFLMQDGQKYIGKIVVY